MMSIVRGATIVRVVLGDRRGGGLFLMNDVVNGLQTFHYGKVRNLAFSSKVGSIRWW